MRSPPRLVGMEESNLARDAKPPTLPPPTPTPTPKATETAIRTAGVGAGVFSSSTRPGALRQETSYRHHLRVEAQSPGGAEAMTLGR